MCVVRINKNLCAACAGENCASRRLLFPVDLKAYPALSTSESLESAWRVSPAAFKDKLEVLQRAVRLCERGAVTLELPNIVVYKCSCGRWTETYNMAAVIDCPHCGNHSARKVSL